MLARPTPYVAWFFASAVLLAISCMVDPHVFGLAAFVAAAIASFTASRRDRRICHADKCEAVRDARVMPRPIARAGWQMSQINRDVVFAALADDNRRILLDRLRCRNGQTLAQLCEGQSISRQAVTKHLRVLEAADLVLPLRQGRVKLHFLNPVPIHAVAMRWLRLFDAVKLDALVGNQPMENGGATKKGRDRSRPAR